MTRLAFPLRFLAIAFLAATAPLPVPAASADGWKSLFDGVSLAGWKAAEHADAFRVVDGAIVCHGPRAHLFYVGTDGAAAEFENFEFSVEVRAKQGANSGIFFHTAWQETSWPAQGFEVQVNNSAIQHGNYLELKKTGSLYGIHNVYRQLAPDDEWFTLAFSVQRPRVEIRVNGVLVVEYTEPAMPLPTGAPKLNRLGRGTFALQAHDPESVAAYRNIRVKSLPSGNSAAAQPTLDSTGAQRLALARDNFPLVDLHTNLTGDLTVEKALQLSRANGMGLGIVTKGGEEASVKNDAAALAFLESMKGKPVFLGLHAEGREGMALFTKGTRAKFHYVSTDAMTFTNAAGKKLRLWVPEESDIGKDAQAFMEELVAQTVKIIETEPIDVYANPTFLPASIADRYDELWTDARMQRVIAAAAQHGVAIEINTRHRLPSEKFLRLAKTAGAKFTIGSNNTSGADWGDWSYAFEMQKKVSLSWRDMFVPGYKPSRAQRELNAKP